MPLEAHVDRTRCIGSGVCARVAAGTFELDDDGIAVVVDSQAASRTELVAAADLCPTSAIVVFDNGRRIR
ncbi:MAG: ferredoxin [Actinomycetota bacterium]|nr:ferredoxin [Actinomycetota bacterium]